MSYCFQGWGHRWAYVGTDSFGCRQWVCESCGVQDSDSPR